MHKEEPAGKMFTIILDRAYHVMRNEKTGGNNMCKEISLCELNIGQQAVICCVGNENGLSEGLSRLGIAPGASVQPLFASPLGGLRAYLFPSVMLALRDEDTKRIMVSAK